MNLDHFLATPGTSARLAEQLGVTPGFVSQWRTGHRPVPIEHCAEIERATDGQVTRQELRPDDWQKIWPELAAHVFGQLHVFNYGPVGTDAIPDKTPQKSGGLA